METNELEQYAKTDGYYLKLIASFVKSERLNQNLSQADVATAAGINRSTIIQLEQGKSVNLLSLIQILRVLKKLHLLNELERKPIISPLKFAAMEHKQRYRASKSNKDITSKKSTW